MIIKDKKFFEPTTYPPIETPPERPIQTQEWVLVAAGAAAMAIFVAPLWAAAGLACLGPALLLKKYSSRFSEENQKRIDKIFACVTEIFHLLKMGIHSALAKLHLIPLEKVQKGGRPILLVHGYLNNASAWTHYLKVLPEKDLGSVYTIELGHPFLPLSEYAQKVKEKADEIREQTGQDGLILIGHSMGGVVSSLYATKLAEEGRVTHLVTIGSPLNGCPFANIAGIGPNGREMRPSSHLLAEIRQGLEAKKDAIQMFHVGSDADTLVPADSALAGPGIKFRVTDLSHTELLTSKKVSDWVSTQLL